MSRNNKYNRNSRRNNGHNRNNSAPQPINRSKPAPKLASQKKKSEPVLIPISKEVILQITQNNTVFWKMSEDGISNKHSR